MDFFYLSSSLNILLCLIGLFYFVFYIMNINIYNLFYMCTLAWALFLRINLFVFVFVIHQLMNAMGLDSYNIADSMPIILPSTVYYLFHFYNPLLAYRWFMSVGLLICKARASQC